MLVLGPAVESFPHSCNRGLSVTYGPDSRPIDVRVQLPRDVARQVEEIQKNNPEVISRLLVYGFRRQVIFDALAGRLDGQLIPES